MIIGRKPTGTLVIDYLLPGRRLYLLGTGTGLAPFMSIVRDPETYEKFEQVVLVHGVRTVDELAYHDLLVEHLPSHEFLGELVTSKLRYYPTVTRQSYRNMGRITQLIESGKLFADLGLPVIDPANDRVMICGSPAMLRDLKHMLEQRGFKEGDTSTRATSSSSAHSPSNSQRRGIGANPRTVASGQRVHRRRKPCRSTRHDDSPLPAPRRRRGRPDAAGRRGAARLRDG